MDNIVDNVDVELKRLCAERKAERIEEKKQERLRKRRASKTKYRKRIREEKRNQDE